MKFKAVLFDLDGTLLHTVPDLAEATNQMLAKMGRQKLPESTVARYVGKGAENLVHRSLTGDMSAKAADSLFAEGMKLWKAAYRECNGTKARLYDGVLPGLKLLSSAGLRLAVVTNKPEQFSVPLLERTGLRDFFSIIVGGDTYERKKPDPMPVLNTCERLGVTPGEALFIGDSLNDAAAARAAGVACWLLPYGYNEGQPITTVECDAYIESLAEAAERVLKG